MNELATTKTIRVKNNNISDWFNGEIAEKIAAREKLFRKLKKSNLTVGEILYKEARNTILKAEQQTFARKVIWKYWKTKVALENY